MITIVEQGRDCALHNISEVIYIRRDTAAVKEFFNELSHELVTNEFTNLSSFHRLICVILRHLIKSLISIVLVERSVNQNGIYPAPATLPFPRIRLEYYRLRSSLHHASHCRLLSRSSQHFWKKETRLKYEEASFMTLEYHWRPSGTLVSLFELQRTWETRKAIEVLGSLNSGGIPQLFAKPD